ncbi:uncharacterized protein F5891DRAFT_960610 [Suillus fuscotomentosus]|uniref:SUN domain-containing protein n=1 Tax=Suillus fuscotomentosus TaxID=1912939 RepID=A0AAD4DW41_9AGAM|nr:uncharacterized protein F5891DRAFT_960610 [Suillus fuscotomentosus]KAG1895165.1 hypothetical protein F5891DRAFT_960610 [Suillus fuscotomentosus]
MDHITASRSDFVATSGVFGPPELAPIEEHVRVLIKDVLNQHSKDTTALRDYALRSGGATIIPEFTSETFWNLSVGRCWLLKVQSLFTGIDLQLLHGLSAETVLLDDMKHGGCWASPGSHIRLGISLPHQLFVEQVTIDHVPLPVAQDITTAPRKVIIWGLIYSEESIIVPPDLDFQLKTTVMMGGSFTGTYLEIISFEYDVFHQTHIQTFAVSREIVGLQVDFDVIVVEVMSN